MAGSPIVELVGPSYHLADRMAASQSAINCYPKRLDGDRWMMESAPGEVQFADLGSEIRGRRDVEGRWFVVAGDKLYEMNAEDGSSNERGTLYSSTGFVGMAHNTSQLVLVDGGDLYVLTLDSNVFTRITSDGWRGSRDVHELDGYMIFVDPETQQFYLSAIDDSTDLNALDFSSADTAPDNILAHWVSHRQAWFAGRSGAEIWVDSGEQSFPFVRYNSYVLDVGIVGGRAWVDAADTVFWIGRVKGRGQGIVYMASGNQPVPISTTAVEEALAESTDLSQATMWSYQTPGHEFVGINAPGLATTWVADVRLQPVQWHERGEWSDGWQPGRSQLHLSFDGKVYAGTDDGVIVRLDAEANTLDGRALVRERTWPHFVGQNLEPTTYLGLEVELSSGHGGSVTLECSNDGGHTFGPKLLRALGATGRWMQRIRWMALGTSINRVFRLRCSDDVPFSLYRGVIDV